MADLILVASMVSAIVGASYAIARASRWVWTLMQRLTRLTDAFLGEPPGPGLPEGRTGVLDRLAAIEDRLAVLTELEHRVAALEAQKVSTG